MVLKITKLHSLYDFLDAFLPHFTDLDHSLIVRLAVSLNNKNSNVQSKSKSIPKDHISNF